MSFRETNAQVDAAYRRVEAIADTHGVRRGYVQDLVTYVRVGPDGLSIDAAERVVRIVLQAGWAPVINEDDDGQDALL